MAVHPTVVVADRPQISNETKVIQSVPIIGNNSIILPEEEEFFIQELVNHYNNVIDKRQDESSFKAVYSPDRFDVTNAMIRKTDLNQKPIFNRGPGDYWVINFNNQNSYLFIPRFNISYQENTHYAAGMGEIFDVIGYDERRKFNMIRLIKPAIFVFNNNDWELIDKGKLQLSGAEPI